MCWRRRVAESAHARTAPAARVRDGCDDRRRRAGQSRLRTKTRHRVSRDDTRANRKPRFDAFFASTHRLAAPRQGRRAADALSGEVDAEDADTARPTTLGRVADPEPERHAVGGGGRGDEPRGIRGERGGGARVARRGPMRVRAYTNRRGAATQADRCSGDVGRATLSFQARGEDVDSRPGRGP